MKKTLIIVADDYSMNVISLTETGKFKIYQNDFLESELVYLDLKTGKDIILYETRYEEEILEARDYHWINYFINNIMIKQDILKFS